MADPTRNRATHSIARRSFVAALGAMPMTFGVIASAASAASAAETRHASGRPVALITGASSGFGRVSATTLARSGFHVIATMRNAETSNADAANSLRTLARNEDLPLEIIEIDVDSDASVDAGVAQAMERAGTIDVLFNNAGINIPGPVELSMDAARQSFETNVFGQLRLLRAVAPIMRGNRSGLIIQMSSGLGRIVMPTSGMYCATKFAQEAMFESAAYELHPFGVEVAIIQPSDYATRIKPNSRRYFADMMASLSPDDQARARDYAEHIAVAEQQMEDTPAPDPQEVADIVFTLATTPAGERPLRQVAMPPELAGGLNELNGTLEEVQSAVLSGSGLGRWLTLAT